MVQSMEDLFDCVGVVMNTGNPASTTAGTAAPLMRFVCTYLITGEN